MRPCGGNERFDPARERDGFRNLLDERQIPQGRRHLRQDAKEVISRNQVQSARTDSAEPRRHLRLNRGTLEVRPRRIDEHLKPLRVRNRLFRVI